MPLISASSTILQIDKRHYRGKDPDHSAGKFAAVHAAPDDTAVFQQHCADEDGKDQRQLDHPFGQTADPFPIPGGIGTGNLRNQNAR